MPSSTMGGTPTLMNSVNAVYVGGLNGKDIIGNSVPVYPIVQSMVEFIFNNSH